MIRIWKKRAADVGTAGGSGSKEDYRSYVGPAGNYDIISAMVFNLLTSAGLRQHHRLLDIGCGSLRSGRLLIPYLNPGNYIGVEPERRMVREGIAHELGKDLIRLKRPVFSFTASLEEFSKPLDLDYAVAQSIFSHTSKAMLEKWLADVAMHMKDTGAMFATFIHGETDYSGDEWVYPGCVKFRIDTMQKLAEKYGYSFRILNWYHPLQTWAVFFKDHYPTFQIEGGEVFWNRQREHRRSERPGMKNI